MTPYTDTAPPAAQDRVHAPVSAAEALECVALLLPLVRLYVRSTRGAMAAIRGDERIAHAEELLRRGEG